MLMSPPIHRWVARPRAPPDVDHESLHAFGGFVYVEERDDLPGHRAAGAHGLHRGAVYMMDVVWTMFSVDLMPMLLGRDIVLVLVCNCSPIRGTSRVTGQDRR